MSNDEVLQHTELGVRTKNSKSSTTYLLPIPELTDFVKEWDELIRKNLLPTAMWFTPLRNQWGDITLTSNEPGGNRGQLLNRRLRKLFSYTDLPYQSAHKFRHGHAQWGISHCNNIGEYKVLSQNLSHESIAITDQIYSGFNNNDRRKIINGLAKNKDVLHTS